jgi:HlyD family secretion protein
MSKPDPDPSLDALLGPGAQRRWWQRRTVWLLAALLLAAAIGFFWWQGRRAAEAAPRWVTQPVTRGSVAITVTANGTLQPTRSVSIGSELSGTVARVLVDVNDRVKKGQALVELDPAKLQDAIVSAQATLASSQATVRQSEATLREARANLARLEEVAQLSGGKVPSKAELDTGRATQDRAEADLAAARAAVTQAQATLSTNQTNLAKATIRSPIDGVVLTRSVEPGAAVAASLQAVTLMTIAEDLTGMQLQVNVDEADVGQVQPGQRATFTVAAQAGRAYPATITRVAYGSTTTDNVVTYTTRLDVRNDDLSLRPGMTATATIAATEHTDVLRVPNPALRFQPQGARPAGSGQAAGESRSLISRLMPGPPRMPRSGGRSEAGAGSKPGDAHSVWVLEDGRPRRIPVTTGLSDGKLTEVRGDGLREGMAVITEQQSGPAAR